MSAACELRFVGSIVIRIAFDRPGKELVRAERLEVGKELAKSEKSCDQLAVPLLAKRRVEVGRQRSRPVSSSPQRSVQTTKCVRSAVAQPGISHGGHAIGKRHRFSRASCSERLPVGRRRANGALVDRAWSN